MSAPVAPHLRVGVLGPLVVAVDGVPVPVAGARLRAVTCRLAVDPGQRVSATALVDAVWPAGPPTEPANALQSLVSRLRRALGRPELLVQDGSGYRLLVDAADLDAGLLATQVTAGDHARAAGDLDAAGRAYGAALALYRGEPLVDAGDAGYVSALVARWEGLRLRAARGRVEGALVHGDGAGLVEEVAALAAEHPLDESLQLLEMQTLVAAGRTPEALAAYDRTRRRLAQELGTDPGPELAALHLALLRAQPAAGREAPARSTNLRARLTSFVGREDELASVLATVAEHRLVTLVGPGGAGKTRLATEAATRWLDAGGESAWLVELAPVTEPANLGNAFLAALGLRDARVAERTERAAQDTLDRLVERLQDTACLLVVDNCEHLLDATAALLARVLGEAPGVRVLATSREALAVDGEVLRPLSSLGLPPAGTDAAGARPYPAVRLWLDRAAAVRSDFVLDDVTVGPVVEIVRRLDGLPLALELAAARLGVLPVAEIARRLSDRFRLLTGGNRAGLPRHRTLRAVVEWSWDLLAPDERLLAERLAVFPAGTQASGALAVCAADGWEAADVDALLLALVEKSLLATAPDGDADSGRVRFSMLETIREYGLERLASRGELDAARAAHARFFAALVEALEPVLRTRDQLGALRRLETERENVLAALRYLGEHGQGRAALRMALALAWYWSLLDSSSEAVTWLRFAVDVNHGSGDPDLVYAEAALAVAELAGPGSAAAAPSPDWQSTRRRLADLAELVTRAPPPPFPGLQVLVPMIAMFAGRTDLTTRALEVAAASPDPWLRAAVQTGVANFAENEGDVALMRSASESAYADFVAIGDRWGLSAVLLVRAQVATFDGRLDDALAAYEEAVEHVAALGSTQDGLYLQILLADLIGRRGEPEQARVRLTALLADAAPGALGERELFAEAALARLELDADPPAALARVRALRVRVAERPVSVPLAGHLSAVAYVVAATAEAVVGEVAQAGRDVRVAYASGVGTDDMPIVAGVGLAVAAYALARHRPGDAAAALGAAAVLRGAEDPTDTLVVRLTAAARAALGGDFDPAYARGRALDRAEAIARLDPARLDGEGEPAGSDDDGSRLGAGGFARAGRQARRR